MKVQNTQNMLICISYGEDLRKVSKLSSINLSWLIKAYKQNRTKSFFNPFFTKLAGTKTLQTQLEKGVSESVIKASWKKSIDEFKIVRNKYLIYQ